MEVSFSYIKPSASTCCCTSIHFKTSHPFWTEYNVNHYVYQAVSLDRLRLKEQLTSWDKLYLKFRLRASDTIAEAPHMTVHKVKCALTFMGPRIANVFSGITNEMQRYTIYLSLWNALHVSGHSSAHHQELKNCIYSIGILSNRYCYLPLSWKRWDAVKVWQSTRFCI